MIDEVNDMNVKQFSKKMIELHKKKVEYTLKVSKRAKRMRLAIYCDGNLVITVPRGFNLAAAENFILQKADWIIKKLDYFSINRRQMT